MKFHLFFLLLFGSFCLSSVAQDHPCSHVKCSGTRQASTAIDYLTPQQRGTMDNYDLKYHRMEWNVDPDTFYIQGAITSYFEIKADSAGKIVFELNEILQVDSVLYQKAKLTYTHSSPGLLTINLPVFLKKDVFDSLTVYYHGNPTNTTGSFVKDFHSDASVIWTLSEPYGSKDWWPCKHTLNDKIDSIDVYITIPGKLKAASNGILVSEKIDGDKKIVHWKHRYPIPAYLVAIAITNYVEFTDYVTTPTITFPVLNYVYPEDSASVRNKAWMTVPIMETYIDLFGPYPFENEKYGHAQMGRNGGMEHQTMTFVGNFKDYLIAHELAHQWFGDKITCGSWQDIWVNESFATYAEHLYYEFYDTNYDLAEYRRNKILYVTAQPYGSVFVYGADTLDDSRVFDYRLSYCKGGIALHMLRQVMGDSAFFVFLKNFMSDSSLVYGYAYTGDVIRHAEAASGKDLKWFFNDWIYNEGYPSFNIGWKQSKQDTVYITIKQSQTHPSVDFFRLPVKLLLHGAKDTLICVWDTLDNQLVVVLPGFKVTGVFFDPYYDIISAFNAVTNIGEPGQTEVVKISPNPFSSELYAEVSHSVSGTDEFIISDISGRIVKTFRFSNHYGDTKYQLDLSELAPGSYILQIRNEDATVFKRIVKK